MSEREWKPGDVAMVTLTKTHDGRTERAWLHNDGCWTFADGNGGHSSRDDVIAAARPLVVLDPENADDMRRLSDALRTVDTSGDLPEEPMTFHALKVRAALRELANPTPPKPDEPTGLGAVVESADGDHWIRHCLPTCEDGAACIPWRRVSDCLTACYGEIRAVRVLSEGVVPE